MNPQQITDWNSEPYMCRYHVRLGLFGLAKLGVVWLRVWGVGNSSNVTDPDEGYASRMKGMSTLLSLDPKPQPDDVHGLLFTGSSLFTLPRPRNAYARRPLLRNPHRPWPTMRHLKAGCRNKVSASKGLGTRDYS